MTTSADYVRLSLVAITDCSATIKCAPSRNMWPRLHCIVCLRPQTRHAAVTVQLSGLWIDRLHVLSYRDTMAIRSLCMHLPPARHAHKSMNTSVYVAQRRINSKYVATSVRREIAGAPSIIQSAATKVLMLWKPIVQMYVYNFRKTVSCLMWNVYNVPSDDRSHDSVTNQKYKQHQWAIEQRYSTTVKKSHLKAEKMHFQPDRTVTFSSD